MVKSRAFEKRHWPFDKSSRQALESLYWKDIQHEM